MRVEHIPGGVIVWDSVATCAVDIISEFDRANDSITRQETIDLGSGTLSAFLVGSGQDDLFTPTMGLCVVTGNDAYFIWGFGWPPHVAPELEAVVKSFRPPIEIPQPTSTAVPLATATPILPIAATPTSITELIRRLLELSYVSLGNYYVVGQDGQYLGVIDSSKHAADSICSTHGPYGSKYSSTSMRNKYSNYGSAYVNYSARSQYAPQPPLIIQNVPGTTNPIVGVITINKYAEPGLPQIELDDLYAALGCP